MRAAATRCPDRAVRRVRDIDVLRGVVVEDFEALERRSPDDNPLALLREWLAEAGLACDRLRPFDVRGAHLLLAAAVMEPEAAAA